VLRENAVTAGAVGEFHEEAGLGVEGTVNGNHWLLGSRSWLQRQGVRVIESSLPEGSTSLLAEGIWSGTFRRAAGELALTISAGKLTFVPRARVGWGEFLPLQSQFPLGGDDGFPGYAVHELRGDRELFGGVQTDYELLPSLSIRLLVAAGRSALGGSLFTSEDWLAGVQVSRHRHRQTNRHKQM